MRAVCEDVFVEGNCVGGWGRGWETGFLGFARGVDLDADAQWCFPVGGVGREGEGEGG